MKAFRMTAVIIAVIFVAASSDAWFDETHLAIAKAAGYAKWYNAAAADVSRIKLGAREGHNHYHNNPRDARVTAEMVLGQAQRYDQYDPDGHLYGAIIASFRATRNALEAGRYAGNHMAYLVHYIGDLSMPLHNTMHNAFNKKYHLANDGIIDNEIIAHIDQIKIYPIHITCEEDLAEAVAGIANLSKNLGYKMEDEKRLMTRAEAYRQVGHSASLLKAVIAYLHSH